MPHLGFVVYFWGLGEQDRLLAGCLRPLVERLRADGAIRGFYFDRYDARGSHVFGVLTPRSAAGLPAVRAELQEQLTRFLREQPSRVELSAQQLERAHRQCRGRQQCAADGLPGLAVNNSFELFEHPADGTPFSLGRALGTGQRQRLWALVDDLCTWSLERIASTPPARRAEVAVTWVAAVDRQLELAGGDATGYWRFHASTLILSLEQRLAENETEVLDALPGLIGAHNRQAFEVVWSRRQSPTELWSGLPSLIELALEDRHRRPDGAWWLLRSLDHTLLKQLGIPTALQMPLVLHAWCRGSGRSEPEPVAAGSGSPAQSGRST